jgi:hypothetical protein
VQLGHPKTIVDEEVVYSVAVGIHSREDLLQRTGCGLNDTAGRTEVVLLGTGTTNLGHADGASHSELAGLRSDLFDNRVMCGVGQRQRQHRESERKGEDP